MPRLQRMPHLGSAAQVYTYMHYSHTLSSCKVAVDNFNRVFYAIISNPTLREWSRPRWASFDRQLLSWRIRGADLLAQNWSNHTGLQALQSWRMKNMISICKTVNKRSLGIQSSSDCVHLPETVIIRWPSRAPLPALHNINRGLWYRCCYCVYKLTV